MTIRRYGPMGGTGGLLFDDLNALQNPPNRTIVGITGITVNWGSWVDRLTISYQLSNGDVVTAPHGGFGGDQSVQVAIPQGEVLAGISGRYGSYIDQIYFYTNKGTKLGPFGSGGGDRNFSLVLPPSQILVAFFGFGNVYLDAIGLIVDG